jgi:hypothetical protein
MKTDTKSAGSPKRSSVSHRFQVRVPTGFLFAIFRNAVERCHWFSVSVVLICKHEGTDR